MTNDRTRKPPRQSAPAKGRRPRADASAGDTEAARGERIAKRLARAGVSSRREAEALILDGRISVNGKVLDSPAVNVMPSDKIAIDGQPIPDIERTRLWLFHKPAGLVTTNRDPEGRPTIFDALPEGLPRVITVGRLDINTEGLLLLTNDGGLARQLELPATGWLRRYRVRVHGHVDQPRLDELKNGIAVDGVFYGSIEAVLDREQGSNAWLTIALREGKNREVKNVMGALGLEVSRLIRVSYGPFQLADLAEGAVREIRGRALREQLGDRLIEEAGANFDAPILNEFTNAAVTKDDVEKAGAEQKRGPKPDAGARREEALGKLQTRPKREGDRGPRKNFGGKPFRKGDRDEEPRRQPGAGSRSAHVWMAPGARPERAEKPKPASTESRPSRATDKPRRAGDDAPRPGRRERQEFNSTDGAEGKPRRDRDFRPRGEGGQERRVSEGEGGRDGFRRNRDGHRPQGRGRDENRPKRFEGERKPRDFDRRERPAESGDGERRERTQRPPRDDKPRGAKPFGEGRRFGGKPDGKPSGGKPSGSKPYGKPAGGRPGGKPAGGRPGGGRPSGGQRNGKPSGRPRGGKD